MVNSARNAYLGASISTASPERLLVMLCERLVLDVQRAQAAQTSGDHQGAHTQLLHAQDIVAELRSSLKVDVWSGAAALGSLYDWLLNQLMLANTRRDVSITAHCLSLAEQICDTWREAAMAHAAAS